MIYPANMSEVSPPESERRNLPRYQPLKLTASLRQKGRLSRLPVQVLDFNRHGLAVCFERPLPKEQVVYLSLETEHLCVDGVIGVVHNCLAQDSGYRCGIRFRPQSCLQRDTEQVEACLARLEQLVGGNDAEAVA